MYLMDSVKKDLNSALENADGIGMLFFSYTYRSDWSKDIRILSRNF